MISNTPGGTDLRLLAYRLQHSYRDTVKHELDQILHQGIIEQASSTWSAR